MFLPEDNTKFDLLRAERQAQYGVAIAYIKDRVGAGTEYANEVARAVLSEAGGYYELAEMPEEFAGALGASIAHRLVAEAEALATVRRLERLVAAAASGAVRVRALSLYVLYAGGSLRERRALFVYDQPPGSPPFTHGALESGVLPRFFKLRLEAGTEMLKSWGLIDGVHFFLAPSHTDSGRCLLATIASDPAAVNLSYQPVPPTMN